MPTKITKEAYAEAEWFAALGEPTRLAIVRILASGEKTPVELSKLLGIIDTVIGHHLKTLDLAGVSQVSRKGKVAPRSLANAVVKDGNLELTSPTGLKVVLPLW